MEETKKAEVAFNFGVSQSYFVGDIYKKVFNSYLAGDIMGWFWNLKALREIMNVDIDKKVEQPQLDQDEENIVKLNSKVGQSKNRKEYTQNKLNLQKAIIDYQRKIMSYMREQGYLPTKKDRTRLGF